MLFDTVFMDTEQRGKVATLLLYGILACFDTGVARSL